MIRKELVCSSSAGMLPALSPEEGSSALSNLGRHYIMTGPLYHMELLFHACYMVAQCPEWAPAFLALFSKEKKMGSTQSSKKTRGCEEGEIKSLFCDGNTKSTGVECACIW